MSDASKARLITPEEADVDISSSAFLFQNTEDLEPLDDIVGQARALRALDLGLGVRHASYNIYIAGVHGMGKERLIHRALKKRVSHAATPKDWVYVYNFDRPFEPVAISLKAGDGIALKQQMQGLVDQLRDELPKAFRQGDFSNEKRRLSKQYETEGDAVFKEFNEQAKKHGITMQQAPDGQILMIPLKDGKTLTQDDFDELPESQQEEISERQRNFAEPIRDMLSKQREIGRKLQADVLKVEREFAAKIIAPFVEQVANTFGNHELTAWLDRVSKHMADNLAQFQGPSVSDQAMGAMMLGLEEQPKMPFFEYQVNVLVDNSQTEGAPVVVEQSPNYKKLFGTIHGLTDATGKVITDFTQIQAGSLLRANGGYLIFNFVEALMEPLVWKELKRTIQSGLLEFHMYDPFGVFAVSSLRPEAIPLNVKLVVVGSPLVYHLLQLYDEDFSEIFKVKADFASDMAREENSYQMLGQLIKKLTLEPDVLPFQAEGVGELARASCRLAGDKRKLSAEFSRIADIAREASYWARQAGSDRVDASHVRQAIEEKVYRSDQIAERMREMISDGTLVINVEGSIIGQVNGLGYIDLGDYAFGKPSRLTATVGVGATGVINIERECELSGQSFDKAMLIIEGYLRTKFASEHPLAISASIAMEQSYGIIEGDSASLAELLCLLSAVAQRPLRQDIAVTGSIDQKGRVQAVGGVCEKIEGFFDVCQEQGLTGTQGVCIPSANLDQLMLRPDILTAMREQRFHVWVVDDVDQAIELLSGIPAGDVESDETFHCLVDQRLREMLDVLKEENLPNPQREPLIIPSSAPRPKQPDPRPTMPGRE